MIYADYLEKEIMFKEDKIRDLEDKLVSFEIGIYNLNEAGRSKYEY